MPPISRTGTPFASAAASSRSASATMSASGATCSALDTLHQLDSDVADVDEVAPQDAVVGLAAGVHAHRRADLPLAAGFVDMPMDREERLALLDQPANCGRADRAAQDVARGDGRAQGLVEDRGGVEARVVWRHVDHEDGTPRIVHLLRKLVEAPVQLLLRHFAGRL